MKRCNSQKPIIIACMLIYLACVLYITLFSRTIEAAGEQRELFWSYKAMFEGDTSLGREILLNIGLFVPLGFILSMLFDKAETWVNILLTVIISLAVSVAVEYSQLIFHLGLFEYDDMISNTLGGLIGGLCSLGVRRHLPKASVWLAVACCAVGIIGAVTVR